MSLPTTAVPKASGLPHCFVVSAWSSSSLVRRDRVSWEFPGLGMSPACAALRSAFSHAETFAAKPSGLEDRCRLKSE